MSNMHNIFEVAGALFGIERNARPSQRAMCDLISHKLYRHSPHGLGVAPLDSKGNYLRGADGNEPIWGVSITGIVEGTDIEDAEKLMFPFNVADFWRAAQSVSDRLDDAQADWEAQE